MKLMTALIVLKLNESCGLTGVIVYQALTLYNKYFYIKIYIQCQYYV